MFSSTGRGASKQRVRPFLRDCHAENASDATGRPGIGMTEREQSWSEGMRAERRGDVAAYERLLKDIATAMRRMVHHRLAVSGQNPNDAEDLVQEVLIGVHAKRHTWDQDRPFLPWLYAIARYKLIDAGRRSRREGRLRADMILDELAEWFEAPAPDLDRATLNVEKHLSHLPDHQQSVVRALAVESASVRATARALNTSEEAVRVTFQRALRRLMKRAASDANAPRTGK
ncbi:MAG: sigma-70 family RNA polymerase sigma factor [Inquilinus sp.]|uniref:sigma-70 family RNA polymerase sigma factor n=1 Tax=Inquilinus sp. TaxID=1932117 RepID=UPI003F3D59CF